MPKPYIPIHKFLHTGKMHVSFRLGAAASPLLQRYAESPTWHGSVFVCKPTSPGTPLCTDDDRALPATARWQIDGRLRLLACLFHRRQWHPATKGKAAAFCILCVSAFRLCSSSSSLSSVHLVTQAAERSTHPPGAVKPATARTATVVPERHIQGTIPKSPS